MKQRDREVLLMLRALSRPQGFGPLGVVSGIGDRQFVPQPPAIPPGFVAYAVLSEWPEGSAHMTFEHLEQPGRFARICLVGRRELVAALRSAEGEGWLGVEEEARFNRVSRAPGREPMSMLEALYARA